MNSTLETRKRAVDCLLNDPIDDILIFEMGEKSGACAAPGVGHPREVYSIYSEETMSDILLHVVYH